MYLPYNRTMVSTLSSRACSSMPTIHLCCYIIKQDLFADVNPDLWCAGYCVTVVISIGPELTYNRPRLLCWQCPSSVVMPKNRNLFLILGIYLRKRIMNKGKNSPCAPIFGGYWANEGIFLFEFTVFDATLMHIWFKTMTTLQRKQYYMNRLKNK